MGIQETLESASGELEAKSSLVRESRAKSEEAVRLCGRAMQLAHAGRMEESKSLINDAHRIISSLESREAGALIAQQEYVEAVALISFLEGSEIPHYSKLGVSPEAFLLGMCDALGELRREIVEHMRKDDYATATRLFEEMSGIYELMLPMRFSNSLLPGFRRKLDVGRSSVEQCRRDLLMYKISKNI